MKKAFTLIELMIVITIVMVLSTIGVGTYRSARATMTLDLEVDRMVSVLQKFESDVRSTSSSIGPICIAVEFTKEKAPTQTIGKYKNAVDGCEWTGSSTQEIRFSTDISVGSNLSILFTPPTGKMRIDSEEKQVLLALKRDPNQIRKIQFNTITGTIEKIK